MKETTEDIREWGFKRYIPNSFNLFGLSNLLVFLILSLPNSSICILTDVIFYWWLPRKPERENDRAVWSMRERKRTIQISYSVMDISGLILFFFIDGPFWKYFSFSPSPSICRMTRSALLCTTLTHHYQRLKLWEANRKNMYLLAHVIGWNNNIERQRKKMCQIDKKTTNCQKRCLWMYDRWLIIAQV